MPIAKKKGKIQTKQIDFDTLCRFSSKVLDEPREDVSFVGVNPEFLPQAKNIIEWIETPGFLHSQEDLNPNKPFLYPKSHGILRDYFELLCPYCNDLQAVRSGLVHRDDEIRFEYARDPESGLPTVACALCGVSYLEALRANRLVNYIEMALCVGMRAGKTYLAAEIATYVLHRLLGCSSARRTFGVAEGAALEIAFVASTALQAKDTIWATFKVLLSNSPWFKAYLADAEQREEMLPQDADPIVRVMDTRMEFNEAGIVCVSLNSNSGGLAGRTRIYVFLDELARFDAGDSKLGAGEVYRVLSNSLKTLRVASKRLKSAGVLPPIEPAIVSISSPIHEEDMIMRLIKEAKQIPEKRIYSEHLRTTEMNPEFTEEDFEAEKAADPIGAERDFGARPMGSGVRLFPQSEPIYAACRTRKGPKLLDWDEEFFDEGGTSYVRLVLKRCIRDLVTPRFIHCDPGQTGDSFGLVIGHMEGYMPQYTVVIDAMIEIRPLQPPKGSKMKPREVYFESVLKFILDLRKFINIAKVQFDQWESVQYIQRLRGYGVPVAKHTIEAVDYKNFRIDVIGGRVEFPPPEIPDYDRRLRKVPIAKALHELKMLEWVTPDKKVDHPKGGSKDIADCVCGVHRLLTWDIFDESTDRRKRPSSPPEGRGYHVSQYQRLQRDLRVGRVVRFAR